jgi:hypothetical protein
MNTPSFFSMFTAGEKVARIRKLAASMSEQAVADITGLSLEQVRQILGEEKVIEESAP